jgi:unsaturated rhamnogalacturonyl hydrolase
MMRTLKIVFPAIIICCNSSLHAQRWSEKMAGTVMTIWKDSMDIVPGEPVKWRYDQGVILKGIEGLWLRTGEKKYFDYIQKSMDFFVGSDGTIRTYKQADYNLDNILPGRNLLMLFNVTGKPQYYKAASTLREQLNTHPRISSGGFWHKKIYPNQMWLDGLYMAEPFYADWSNRFSDDVAYDDIARQFILMEQYSRDPSTGLLFHGYDHSREQQWADKKTGRSPNIWARAMGWYGMALVDVLEKFPVQHPKYDSLLQIIRRFSVVAKRYQDKKTGLWWDIVDLPGKQKNYPEASASSMLVYTLAKAARFGWIDSQYATAAKQGYDGIIKSFIKTENGQTNLHGTVSVSGLGGKPYRDGSFNYYVGEPVIVNDPKGIGAFLLAANEIEMMDDLRIGAGKKVSLDYYFNHETKKDVNGKTIQTHYTWEQMDNGGFSLLGNIFRRYGAKTSALTGPPTSNSLQNSDVYIIVDPDSSSESASPNYIQPDQVEAINNWVQQGGVLLLFANDSANTEFNHLNQLASAFGLKFKGDSKNRVQGTNFEQGGVQIPAGNPVFKSTAKVYIKEYSTLDVSAPARTILNHGGAPLVAMAPIGKGFVFAVGDPWLYNEYVDGRKIPPDFQNYRAAEELVRWALTAGRKVAQSGKKSASVRRQNSVDIKTTSGNSEKNSVLQSDPAFNLSDRGKTGSAKLNSGNTGNSGNFLVIQTSNPVIKQRSVATDPAVATDQDPKNIVVSLDGKGDHRSIQAAINSLPDSSAVPRIIFLRNGIYNEKIYLEKHNVILRGEDREKTIITQAIARDEWRCKHNDDWGVASFNVDANDITLENLTIINSYGRDNVKERFIPCLIDTSGKPKAINRGSHQMALRTMNATRLKAINCRFTAYGGDTVSPWNVDGGLFYFKDCIMEGGVDFYCPRGWAYAENCQFIVQSGTAAIWHDGSRHEDSKTVLKDCSFSGYDGFRLGRYHRDAQFYLINCRFPANMADADIYLVPTDNEIKWGRRVYYYNCKRTGGDYSWHANNLKNAPGDLTAGQLTPTWVFGDKWPGFSLSIKQEL